MYKIRNSIRNLTRLRQPSHTMNFSLAHVISESAIAQGEYELTKDDAREL